MAQWAERHSTDGFVLAGTSRRGQLRRDHRALMRRPTWGMGDGGCSHHHDSPKGSQRIWMGVGGTAGERNAHPTCCLLTGGQWPGPHLGLPTAKHCLWVVQLDTAEKHWHWVPEAVCNRSSSLASWMKRHRNEATMISEEQPLVVPSEVLCDSG